MIHIRLFLSGIVIGVANVIPGLSGGTMALLMGIYPKLLSLISEFSSFNLAVIKKEYRFISILAAGLLTGVVLFSHVIGFFLEFYPEPSSYFFITLVLLSLPHVFDGEASIMPRNFHTILLMIVFFSLGLFMSFYEHFGLEFLSSQSEAGMLFLVLSVMLAASAMIVPGISGALMLLLFGTYSTVISAIKGLDYPLLAIIFLSTITGIVIVSKVINYCLKHYRSATLFSLVALILGTLPGLFVGFTLSLLPLNLLAVVFAFVLLRYLSR